MKSFITYLGCCAVAFLFWVILITLVVGAQTMLGCKPKPKADQTQTLPPAPPIDSTRLDLEIKVKGSSNTVTVSQGNSQTAVADYEKAKNEFDKTRVTLP